MATRSGVRQRSAPATLRGSLTNPTAVTLGLTLTLALAGGALTWTAASSSFLGPAAGSTAVATLALLALAFFVTELGQALVEVRRQAYSYSLAGIPMALGLLYLPPRDLIAVRVGASLVAFLVQRAPPLKLSFNTASYLLDTALVLAAAHLVLGVGNGLTLRTAVLCYLCIAVVDLLMSLLVLLAIRINQDPVSRSATIKVLVPASAFVFLNTVVAFIAAILFSHGTLGVVLLVLLGSVTAVVYRGYVVLRRRHQSLQVVQCFVDASEATGSLAELAGRMLVRIRELVRASRVELRLQEPDGTTSLLIVVDEFGDVTVGSQGRRATDLLTTDAGSDAVLITTKTASAAQLGWLRDRGVRDALVVPLTRPGTHGTLVAVDRLGDTTRFRADDLGLLQTLAGHLAVSLHSTQLVARLRHEASHDLLTGLPNRSLLADRMQHALSATRATGRTAVLLLDLDRFKEVNDALGHHVGDELLQVVGHRLTEMSLVGATVARLGGDEFAVLLPGLSDATREAVVVGERIAAVLSAPVDLPEAAVSMRASIGVAVAQAGDTGADLLRHADTAMYAAKGSGAAVAVYTNDLDAGRGERLALLADLHLALERDELDLHYQPKLDLAFDVVTGVEALVRWTHPTRGVVMPDDFIPLAESTGLIDQLTSLVLAKALRQCRSWQDAGFDLTVAVNLSPRNVMNVGLPDLVAVALVDAGLPAHKLILEITESSLMGDLDRAIPILEGLSAIGVTLSLDDFGTGYSSLSYLQRLPVREVKIDRSFVLGLSRVADAHASGVLVRSIISLGESLGLRIVAEGVQSAEVLEELRLLGCDIIQGYQIGRAVPGDELVRSVTRSGLTILAAEASRGGTRTLPVAGGGQTVLGGGVS